MSFDITQLMETSPEENLMSHVLLTLNMLVEGCETFDELKKAVESIGEALGDIPYRTGKAKSVKRVLELLDDVKNGGSFRALTRNFGIRQQAMYIMYYENGKL